MDENPILCGVLDLPLRSGTEQHILDNVCFGQVKWLKPEPKPEQVTCPICKRLMTLLMQVSCPFPGAPGDLSRKLIVAVCLDHAATAAGWRVIRQNSRCADAHVAPTPKPERSDWGDEDDDWGDDDGDEEVDWMAQQVQDLCVGPEPIPEGPRLELGVLRSGHYINVVEDYEVAETEHERELYAQYQLSQQVEHPGGIDSDSAMEDDEDEGDETIDNFLAAVRRMPEQILRYQVRGTPLSLDGTQFSSGMLPPCCDACGATRCFEMQLMPKMVDLTEGRLQFGTVQIFTCSANCTRSPNNVEYVVIQDEPDASSFK